MYDKVQKMIKKDDKGYYLEENSKKTSADVRAPGTEVSPSDWSDN